MDRRAAEATAIGSFSHGVDADPIAHRGKIGHGRRLVAKLAGHFRPALDIARDAIQPALLLDDARERQVGPRQTRDLRRKKRIPPETFA